MYCVPFLRYRLEVYAEDETASTTFVIFNQLAEKILQVPVTDLCMQKEKVIYLYSFTSGKKNNFSFC